MLTVIIFILVLGLLVFVHELGHFVFARRNDVEVEEFGFGFPPRIAGIYRDENGKRKIVFGRSDPRRKKNTIFSINWIPLGGFVKIKGEDGEDKSNPHSFAAKSPWVRIRILAAGVGMNFLLAIFLFSINFYSGVPQPVEEVASGKAGTSAIQIIDVAKNSPAEQMGLQIGDEIMGARSDGEEIALQGVSEVQNYISERKGQEITLEIKRGRQELILTGKPREQYPAEEGSLGISLADIVVVKYPWCEALFLGAKYTFNLTVTFLSFLGIFLWRILSGQSAQLDVSGPVGIAVVTGQVAKLGFSYLIRFTALLSVNLAIINILPIPALDGGRILFILFEKIKGAPLSQKIEQRAHNIGFALLISLMIFVTVRDFMKFDIFEKFRHLFG